MESLFHTLGIDQAVIVTNIISFLLLYLLLKKYMIGPVSGILAQRRSDIESSYQRIADETAKVQQLQTELDSRLTEIEAEGRAKIQEATASANRMKDEILAEARAHAEQVKERGVADIERERDKALQSIREHVADLVAQASSKIVGESLDDSRHRALIKSALDELEASKN
ncbi:MAG: F0F1 ATP synthase subunit B [Armatimonadetes bacterium]|nr:F0F1 ATP synthase subunit B [Armatimonadota bacterium]